MNRDEAIRRTRAALRALELMPADVGAAALNIGYTGRNEILITEGIEKAAEAAGKEIKTTIGYTKDYDLLEFVTDEGVNVVQLQRVKRDRDDAGPGEKEE